MIKHPIMARSHMPGVENRKHTRIQVAVPVYYTSLDDQGTTLNFNMGVVRDVSQSGVALETYSELDSKWVLLSFVDVSDNTLELRGKLVYSKEIESGKYRLGVMLLGSTPPRRGGAYQQVTCLFAPIRLPSRSAAGLQRPYSHWCFYARF